MLNIKKLREVNNRSDFGRLKVTIVGDDDARIRLLQIYEEKGFPERVWVNEKQYIVDIWSTAEYGEMRDVIWLDTHCFVLCYSQCSRRSYKDVKRKWLPQIRRFSDAPIILVEILRNSVPNSENFVKPNEGLRLCEEIAARCLVRCTGELEADLNAILKAVVRELK